MEITEVKTAVAAQIAGFRTLVDGSARVSVDLPLEHVERWLMEVGTSVALAPLEDKPGAVQTHDDGGSIPSPTSGAPRHPYGQQAKALRLSSFCRTPAVWKAVGTDKQFLTWLATQPCAAATLGNCSGDVVAAHVRRIANGAGTGIKPEYSAVPLCHAHHSKQHNEGEAALWDRTVWDALRIAVLEDFVWAKLHAKFNVDHIYNLEPVKLFAWAKTNNIEKYLPEGYRC